MKVLRVYLTGELCLTDGNLRLGAARLPGRQGRVAFAHLVTERAHPVSRDALAEVVWPLSLPPAHDVALSAIVSKLRAQLEAIGLGRDALTAASGCY